LTQSAIYTGLLNHRRFSPRPHAFTYPLFMAFLDIDHIPEIMAQSKLSSYNHWNWATFDERDHFGDPKLSQRQRLEIDAATNGIELPAGPIFLLTHLRYLGYNFNPVSFYFCYDAKNSVKTILAEVHNTFGELHNYWLTGKVAIKPFQYRTPKVFHVSPFMSLDHEYQWTFTEPAEKLVVHMSMHAPDAPFFDATLTLNRQPWNPQTLRATLIRHPWMTAKVIAAIHWEALRLFLKRVPVFDHPKHSKAQHEPLD